MIDILRQTIATPDLVAKIVIIRMARLYPSLITLLGGNLNPAFSHFA
jgi:hypothetical protein